MAHQIKNGIIVGLLNKGMKVSSILEDVNLANHIKKSSSNFQALVHSYSDEPMVNPFEKDVQVALDLAATFNPIPFASRSDIIASQQAALTKFNIAHNSNKSLLPLVESPITNPSSSTVSLPISTHHLSKPSNPSHLIGASKDDYIKGIYAQNMLGYHEVSFLADVIERPIAVVRKVQQQPIVETIYTSADIKDKPPVYVINFNNFHFEAWKPRGATQNTLNVGDVCSGNVFKANRGSGNSKSNDCLLDSLRSYDDVNAMLTKKIGNNQDIRDYLGSKLQSVDASYFASNQVNRFEVKSSQTVLGLGDSFQNYKDHVPDQYKNMSIEDVRLNYVFIEREMVLSEMNANGEIKDGKRAGKWLVHDPTGRWEYTYDDNGNIIQSRLIVNRLSNGEFGDY